MLEDLEDEKYRDLDFVELDACAGGCVGGVLQVGNPHIAKGEDQTPAALRACEQEPSFGQHSHGRCRGDTDLTYAPVLELGGTRTERFERSNQMEDESWPSCRGWTAAAAGRPPVPRWPRT